MGCGTETPVQETVSTPVVEVPPGTLRGEVEPVADGAIQVQLLTDGRLLTQIETTGSYEFPSIDAGDYTLQVSAKGYETAVMEITLASGQTLGLETVTLVALESPVSHLQGVLTDESTGEPIGDINLQLMDEAGSVYEALTTGAGVFSFDNLPVEHVFTLTVEHADYESLQVALDPIPAAETRELQLQLVRLPEIEELKPGQGLPLDSQAPLFELTDGGGKMHALADYIGQQNVVLVFYRGGW